MKKRLLSLLLALVMLVGMIPATTLTAFAESGGVVYVGGVAMYDGDYLAAGATATTKTKPSGGYAYWSGNTLTLHDFSASKPSDKATIFTDDFPSYDQLEIVLEGDNNIQGSNHGILSYTDVIISGTGSLTINGFSSHGHGIAVMTPEGNSDFLTINSGTLKIYNRRIFNPDEQPLCGCIYAKTTMNGGYVYLYNRSTNDADRCHPYIGKFTFNGGVLLFTALEDGAEIVIANDAFVKAGYHLDSSNKDNEFLALNRLSAGNAVGYMYAPSFAAQTPAMPTGNTTYHLGKVVAEQYPIYMQGIGVTQPEVVEGEWHKGQNGTLKETETLTVTNSKGEQVFSKSKESKDGKGISYDLKDLPADTYTIEMKITAKAGDYQATRTNTFTIDWQPGKTWTINGTISGVTGTTKTTVELYKSGSSTPMATTTVTGNGNFIFNNVEEGSYTIKATAEGYITASKTFMITPDTAAVHPSLAMRPAIINNVNVSATFSGTPAKATTSTTGATVTATKWYKKNGSSWTELGASDTIKEGYTYRCEVTVGATGDYALEDGYTVKINGIAATKKSGNTWYRDVTITGYTSYVDVYDIALPEAFTNPDFTYNDEEGAAYHWDVVQVEWFECDKDGHILSGALTENDVFQKDTYYRIEVATVVSETNWQFHGSALSFYINGKAAMPLYGYNKAYPDSVTGYVVYNTADIEGDYELFVYDDSLSGSAKNIYIKDGQYLGSNATGATAIKPASGGYAYYKDGVLTLNGYDNEKAHFYFEELALELYLVGDNTIGAIYDNQWGHASNLEVRQGNLVIDAADGGKLTIASNPLDAYANIQVKDLYFNGGELTSCLANDTYGASIALNNGNLYLVDGYEAYVSDTNDFASATKWDGTADISGYDCVWIVEEQATVTHTVTFKVDTTTVATKTVEDGKTVTAPADPTQSGKTFLGWYNGDTKFDFTTPITGDITLTAKFEDATSNVKLGDVNGDDTIDYADIQCIYQHMSTDSKLTGDALIAADVNKDGAVDYGDIQRLYQHLSTDNKLS